MTVKGTRMMGQGITPYGLWTESAMTGVRGAGLDAEFGAAVLEYGCEVCVFHYGRFVAV